MRKFALSLLTLLCLFLSTKDVAFGTKSFLKVNAALSTVVIEYPATDYSLLKVVVEKDQFTYTYDLFSNHDELPLQMGSGKYAIHLYQKVEGRIYNLLASDEIHLTTSEKDVYLSSIQMIDLEASSQSVKMAKKLTEHAKSDLEKIQVIHHYITQTLSYDEAKQDGLSPRYLPFADETLLTQKGICYDYASLTAVMLRSINIPTKLVKGYSSSSAVYHAWNEVYLKGQWFILDTTLDSIGIQKDLSLELFKSPENYVVKKVF